MTAKQLFEHAFPLHSPLQFLRSISTRCQSHSLLLIRQKIHILNIASKSAHFVAASLSTMQSLKHLRRFHSLISTRSLSTTALPSSGLGPKRFYDSVSIEPSETENPTAHAHYDIRLDSKTVLTASQQRLTVPTKPLALAIAAEWDAQQDRIRPSSMPLTTIIGTGRDVVNERRQDVEQSLLRYLHTDTMALRPAHPTELVESQNAAFAPIADMLLRNGISPVITRGGLSGVQSKEIENTVKGFISEMDCYCISALDVAVGCGKSVFVGLALWMGVPAKVCVAAARSEESWQTGVWGVVEGGHDVDLADGEVRFAAAEFVFRCLTKGE